MGRREWEGKIKRVKKEGEGVTGGRERVGRLSLFTNRFLMKIKVGIAVYIN